MLPSFTQFLAEKEGTVVMYGLGKKGSTPGKAMAKSSIKSVKPAKPTNPLDGLKCTEIYGKPGKKKSGIVGE